MHDCALRECDESRGTRYSERHTAHNDAPLRGTVRSATGGARCDTYLSSGLDTCAHCANLLTIRLVMAQSEAEPCSQGAG
jgi:hypothetical protein